MLNCDFNTFSHNYSHDSSQQFSEKRKMSPSSDKETRIDDLVTDHKISIGITTSHPETLTPLEKAIQDFQKKHPEKMIPCQYMCMNNNQHKTNAKLDPEIMF